jgi:hypothetical protein
MPTQHADPEAAGWVSSKKQADYGDGELLTSSDLNLAAFQMEADLLERYVSLVSRAYQADVIANDEARGHVTAALDRLKAMAAVLRDATMPA